MSTILLSVPTTEVTLRWQQPYVSEALNRKASIVPRGVVRGMIPKPNAAVNDTILFVPDLQAEDSVVNGAGEALAGKGDFFVTWRTTSDVSVTIAADNALHFIYFIPGYSIGAATTPQIVDYTEAEYEAGTPQANGGVLLCVVKANAAATPLTSDRIVLGGMTDNANHPFERDKAAVNLGGSQSTADGEEAIVAFTSFNATTDKGQVTVNRGDLSRANGTTVEFDLTDFETGNASLKLTKGALEASTDGNLEVFHLHSFPLWRDGATTDHPRKIRVYARIKVNATFNVATSDASKPTGVYCEVATSGGTAKFGEATSFAPSTGCIINNTTKSTSWKWIIYEFRLPDSFTLGAVPMSARLFVNFGKGLAAGSVLYVDRMFATISREPLSKEADGLNRIEGVNNPSPDTRARAALTLAPHASGAVNNTSFQFVHANETDFGTGKNRKLLLVPDTSSTLNEWIVGRDAEAADEFSPDVAKNATGARYLTLNLLGDGTSSYALKTTNAPITATGTGANIESDTLVTAPVGRFPNVHVSGSDPIGAQSVLLTNTSGTLTRQTVRRRVPHTEFVADGSATIAQTFHVTREITSNLSVTFLKGINPLIDSAHFSTSDWSAGFATPPLMKGFVITGWVDDSWGALNTVFTLNIYQVLMSASQGTPSLPATTKSIASQTVTYGDLTTIGSGVSQGATFAWNPVFAAGEDEMYLGYNYILDINGANQVGKLSFGLVSVEFEFEVATISA